MKKGKADNTHHLLKSQIERHLPKEVDRAKLLPLLSEVEATYRAYETDLSQNEEDVIDQSEELTRINAQLAAEVERKSAEAETLSKRIESIVHTVQEIIFQTDLQGRWTYLNPVWEKVTGYRIEESLGQSFTDMVYPEDKQKSIENLQDLVFGEADSKRYDLRYITNSGKVRWAEAFVTLNYQEDGTLAGASGTLTDITDRQRAQEELLKMTKNMEEAQKIAQVGSWEYEAGQLHQGYWSPETYQILALEKSKGEGEDLRRMLQSVMPEDKDLLEETINWALKSGEAQSIIVRGAHAEAASIIALKVEPLIDEKGMVQKLVGTVHDITQQKKHEEELMASKKLAEEALAAKSEFLSNMSHEIRTPMNAIIGLSSLLLQDRSLQGDLRENLELINYSADNLLVIINDILDYSKIEAKKLHLERLQFDLHEVIEKVVKIYQIKAVEKGLDLDYQIDPDTPRQVVGDPYRLNQILLNLVSNAVKFTKEGGVSIKCSLEKREDQEYYRFQVVDSGIGIPQEVQGQIFDSFTQANSNTTRNFGGTGLGLAICRRLVDMQKGRIWVDSEEGQGSVFGFELPYQEVDSEREALDGSSSGTQQRDLERLAILIAEDNKINQKLIWQILRRWDLEPTLADDGAEAVKAFVEEAYDVVLLDLQMPVMDGFEAIKKIRKEAQDQQREVRIIALTADVLSETREKVNAAGFDGFLAKPYKADDLRQILLGKDQ